MKNYIALIVVLLLPTVTISQSVLVWSRDYPAYLADDFSKPVSLTVENNIIRLDGVTMTQNGQRLLTVRYNMQGDTLSSMLCGGDSINDNLLYDYEISANDAIYILQHEKIEFYKKNLVVQKYDETGNFVWASRISNQGDTSFLPHSIIKINDSCLLVSGFKEYNYPAPGDDVITTISIPLIIAFTTDGTIMWQYEFIESELSYFMHPLLVHSDTAYIFGMNYSLQRNLIKVTADNSYLLIPDIELQSGIGNVQFNNQNRMIVTTGFGLYRTTELTLTGVEVWTHVYPSNLPSYVIADEIKASLLDAAGNIYVTGRHSGEGYNTPEFTNNDILTIKYDQNGNKIWENRYLFGVLNSDIGNRICLKNGYLYVAGESQRNGVGNHTDFIVLKIDNETGETAGIYYYDGEASGNDVLYGIEVLENDSLVITGLSYNGINYHWTTQLLSDVILSKEVPDSRIEYALYPNPADRNSTIIATGEGLTEYRLISPCGMIIRGGKLSSHQRNEIKLHNITPGLYLLTLRNTNREQTTKLVIR